MKSILHLLFGCLLLVAQIPMAWAGPYTGIVAFGDSLTDTGNVSALTGGIAPASPPYYNGRFSNGPLWIERLASWLGVAAPVASLQGGQNYAYAGAQTGQGLGATPFPGLLVPNIGSQIDSYLSAGNTPNASELFVVWGGANDFFTGQADPNVPVLNLRDGIIELANAGAKSFLVGNLPLLGETPDLRVLPGIRQGFNALTVAFNTLLEQTLKQLENSLNISIHRLDVFTLFNNVIADPTAYGFTNVTDAAKSGDNGLPGTVVSNPNEYLYFDGVHPTATTEQLIANAAQASVPEPDTLFMMILGLAYVFVSFLKVQRRKRSV